MPNQNDVRRIALSLPGASQKEGRFAFCVRDKKKEKEFAWVWVERLDPKKARVPNPKVLAVRVVSDDVKQALLASDPKKFFTDPHYDGFPAVLVRLPAIRMRELRALLIVAWQSQRPPT